MKRHILIAALLGLVGASTDGLAEPVGCSSLVARYEGAPLGSIQAPTPLSAEQKVASYLARPCVKSYPWPRGVFFAKTDEQRQITPVEMGQLRNLVDGFVEIYLAGGKDVLLKAAEENGQEEVVGEFVLRMKMGWEPKLVNLYGDYLYIFSLIREGEYESAKSEAARVIDENDIVLTDRPWDEAEAATYFSRETLGNLIILLGFQAEAGSGATSLDEANLLAVDFLEVRRALAEEIEMIGDPSSDLLYNAGCL